MRTAGVSERTVGELVAEFVDISISQGRAIAVDDMTAYNRLVPRLKQIVEALTHREGDQRRALVALYRHEDMQVRLAAAECTLAVAPEEARTALRQIRDARSPPQSFHAGMTLRLIDEGIARPT